MRREFLIYNQLQNIRMKAKQSQLQFNTFQGQVSHFSIDQSLQSQMEGKKGKDHQMKINPTIACFSQNQISTGSLSNKAPKSLKITTEQADYESDHKKSRKSNKKKIIEKNIIMTSRDRYGKSSRILKNKQAQKQKQKQKKAQKLKSATKLIKIKQNILPSTSQPPQIKPKIPILSKTDQKLLKIKLDECAEIRMIGFDRKQLQKKREDLLKRTVDDWNFIQKLRSDKRQLRVLSLC